MTTQQITDVLERVQTWPQKRQQDAARLLLEMEQQDVTPLRLSADQAEDAKFGLAQADNAEFATHDEMRQTWNKFGL